MKKPEPDSRQKRSWGAVIPAGAALLLVLALLTTSSGCVGKLLAGNSDPEIAGFDEPDLDPASSGIMSGASPEDMAGLSSSVPVAEITPVKSEIVTEVAPVVTPDPYPILHGRRINETRQYRFLDRQPEFTKSYTFRGNATGLLINVAQGPLYIVYTVKPQNDCMANRGSCRGDLEKPVQRPYLTITVRDNQTQEILAEDGYGGVYSWNTGNYEVTIESEEGSFNSETSPRHIILYREGQFHITMEGNYLDIDLSIITGASPDPLEVSTDKSSGLSPASTPAPEIPEEEEWW
jgi:hypothetical protein